MRNGTWSYGADYIAVYFKADKEKISRLIPSSLEVTDGTTSAYIANIVGVSEKNPDAIDVDPAQTVYHEAGIGSRMQVRRQERVLLSLHVG